MNPKLKTIVISVIVLIALSGMYLAGNFALPNAIKSSYQGKNCEQVLSLHNFYISVYPASIADQGIAALANECALYALAVKTEGKKTATRQDVYNAYKAYIDHYPQGFFVSDAQEHGALALAALAKEQLAAKKYTDALATIDTIQQNFGKTSVAAEATSLISRVYTAQAKDQLAAKKYSDAIGNINLALKSADATSAAEATSLMSDVYIAWAKDQRGSGDFAGAETTLKTFKTWAGSVKKTDAAKSAQAELAQTSLAWGLDLQTKKQFEDAKAKFDLAISTDPDPSAASGPAAQAKAAQVKMYTAWGDSFVEKNDFANAIDRYQTVVSASEAKDQPAAKDKIVGVYLKWAANLNGSEDFLGAQKQIDKAKSLATTDSAKKDIETAQANIYQAFSKSTGEQAQQAIAEAAEKVCSNKRPDLPIFGIDPEAIHAYLFPKGQGNLTDAVNAATPASMHYVACVTQSTKSETMKNSRWNPKTFQTIAGSNYVVERVTIYWDIQLYDLTTGKMITSQSFEGTAPLGWGGIWETMNKTTGSFASFSGNEPSLEIVSAWIAKYLK